MEERAKVKTREEKALTIAQRRARAQVEVDAYVHARDAELSCISCDRFHEGQWHTGHYRSRSAAVHLALESDNATRRYTADQIDAIRDEYQAKAKQLKKESQQ